MRRRSLATAAGILLLAFSMACGGGGGSSSGSGSGGNSAPALTIVNDSFLHGTLTGEPYSVTLTAQNGVGALTWSISPVSPTAQYVTGLSIDPATGVLSGTANFGGTAGFNARVVDSASPPHSATRSFTVTANSPLQAGGPQSATVGQYQTFGAIEPSFSGGVFPYTFSLSGTIAPGLLLSATTGQITGTALTAGVFVSTINHSGLVFSPRGRDRAGYRHGSVTIPEFCEFAPQSTAPESSIQWQGDRERRIASLSLFGGVRIDAARDQLDRSEQWPDQRHSHNTGELFGNGERNRHKHSTAKRHRQL